MTATPHPPITPVRCTVTGCPWAVHGIPDQYTRARAEYLDAHLAEEHADLAVTAPHPPQDEHLDAIRAREAAATPGPWWADSHEIYAGPEGDPHLGEWVAETCVAGELERSEANARFVAAARTDVPALLAVLAARDAEIQQLRERLLGLTQVRVWRNEDGREFLFADDVRRAVGVPTAGES